MTLHRPPIIANRFEVVLLILTCFIIATRLIWLQIGAQDHSLTDEFYATFLAFSHSWPSLCSAGADTDFPFAAQSLGHHLDPDALTSPGLAVSLLSLCQFKRLDLEAYLDFAPHLITMSAFFVAVTARIMTSSWVGGVIAAGVVLSRGSILVGTHLAGTFLILQPAVALMFLLLALYARTRDATWLPILFATCVISIVISPTFGLLAWPLAVMIGLRAIHHARGTQFSVHRLPLHIISISSALIVFPAIILALHHYLPSSTRGVSTFIKQIAQFRLNGNSFTLLLGSAIAELEQQDLHWQCSLGALAIAATWKRYLPRGSGFLAFAITVTALIALVVDGGLIAAAARQTNEIGVRRIYNMTDAVFSLEPVLIGTAAGYIWFCVRYLVIRLFPAYSSRPRHRDSMETSSEM
jgi:hypothetical protein